MASIRFNQIADARGSINGTVYSRGIGGLYMKNRVKPLNPQSTKQLAVRGQLASLAASWRGLTDAQRDSWKAQTENYPATNRVGESYKPSGYQVYMTLNSNLNAIGQSILSTPLAPADFSIVSLASFDAELSTGVISNMGITFSGAIGANEYALVELTGSLSSGVSSPSSGLFKRVVVSAAGVSAVDLETEYPAAFGQPLEGARIFVRVFIVNANTGQRQLIGSLSDVVTTV